MSNENIIPLHVFGFACLCPECKARQAENIRKHNERWETLEAGIKNYWTDQYNANDKMWMVTRFGEPPVRHEEPQDTGDYMPF